MPILNWLGRDKDVKISDKVPYRLLESVKELSYGDTSSPNMLIQGDNLEALKALLPYYAGKVKCIYIDPPYNTESFQNEHYDDNLEHSTWLSKMYSRFELLRDLLQNDGVIFVQIDDHQVAYLTVILDEIFGRKNRINIISVKMSEATGVKMTHADKRFPKLKEYILFYKKDVAPKIKPIKIKLDKWNAEYKELILGLDESELDKVKSIMEQDVATEYDIAQVNSIMKKADIVSLASYFRDKQIEEKQQEKFKWDNSYRIVQAVGAGSLLSRAVVARVPTQNISSLLSAQKKLYLFKSHFDQQSRDPRIKIIFADKYLQYNPGDFWTDIKTSGGVGQEGGIHFPNGKKPEQLIQRILQSTTEENDLVLDSFLGSGTTAAVAHKMKRRYIGIEMGDHAKTHCLERIKKVIEGEQSGISKDVNWQGGGGFNFYKLGSSIFDTQGNINPEIRFPQLAAHIWFYETKTAYQGKKKSALLGVHDGTAYYLLYNGILGDKSVNGGNVLTHSLLKELPEHVGPKVIYGETSRISEEKLKAMKIVFKQTPYDVKAR